MSAMIPFQFPDTGQPVRIVMIDGEPHFVASDVCAVLGIANVGNALARLDGDDIRSADVVDAIGRVQSTKVVTESGLYDLILDSRKPQAKAFRRWVTSDVIPSIRKTGRYETSAAAELAMPSHATALRGWAAELEAREAAEARVAELEPKADAYDVLASAKGDFSLRDSALILNRDPAIKTGQNRLMDSIREFQMVDGKDVPYANHQTHLTERVRTYDHPITGEKTLAKRPQIRITVAGLRYLHKKLGGRAPLRFDQLPFAEGDAA